MPIRLPGQPQPQARVQAQDPKPLPPPAPPVLDPPTQEPQDPIDLAIDAVLSRRPQSPAAPAAADRDATIDTAITSVLDRRRSQAEDLALGAFAVAVKSDPAVRAEAQDLAQKLGVDPDTAERNRDVMRQYLQVRDQRRRTLAGINPVLARHVANLEFARIAHDDTENLGAVERIFAQWDVGKLEYEQGILGEKLRSGQAAQTDLERLAAVRARLRSMPAPRGLLEGSAKVLGQQSMSLPRALTFGAAASVAAGGAAALAGQAGPQIALPEEVVTVPAAMITGFTAGTLSSMAVQAYQMESGSAYLEMLDQGYDRGVASKAAVGVGVANAMLELVGVKMLAKGAGIGVQSLRAAFGKEVGVGVADALARPTLGAAAKQFAKGFGTGLGGEVFTEVAQEAVNITAEEIARQLSANPDVLSSTATRGEIVQRLVDTAVQTAQGMALLAVPGPALRLHRDGQRARAAEHTVQFWRDLGANVEPSKVKKRSVGMHERFLADAAQGTSAENTYVDGQAFAEVLRQTDAAATEQGRGLEISAGDKLDRVIPGLQQRIADAAARGEDVVIPTALIGSHIAGTEIYQPLVPHLRLDPEAMSFAEAQVFRQQERQRTTEAESILTEAERSDIDFANSAREVEEALRQQLVTAGRTPAAAQTEAKIYRDLVIVKSRQLGVQPADFHAQYPLRVLAGELSPDGQVVRQGDGVPVDSEGGGADDLPGDNQARPAAEREQAELQPGAVGAERGTSGVDAAEQPARWVARSDVPGVYASRTDLVETHTRELGAERVTTAEEAAQALAYLGRGAVERFDALITDANGRPLAIVGSFKGGVAEASVHTATIVSEAFRIEGAANVWFAHNHPGGSNRLSREDRMMHLRLIDAFRGSRIQSRGLFAIEGKASDDRSWVFEPSDATGPAADVFGEATKPKATISVSVVERVLSKDGRLGPPINGPEDAWHLARSIGAGEAGAILLDTQLRPLAFVPVDPKSVSTLRRDGRMDELYRAVSVANAAAVVVVENGKLGDSAVQNLALFFRGLQLRVLDIVDTGKGPGDSWGARGKQIDVGTFKSGDRGFYRPRDLTIFLTKQQNASTFLHELAHHYLHTIADLAQRKANPRILDDFQALLDWFGVQDVRAWHALSFKQQEEHHEAFARSFESWLFEGKAPNRELEGAFARVARWLREVYGTIVGEINAKYRAQFGKDLPALTPEVRAVMGRMLASEQEVEHATAVQNLADTYTSQDQAEMDDPTWAEHQALVDDARDEAVATHTRDSLRQLQWYDNARSKRLREAQKKHAAARSEVREEVEAELRMQPVYRARRWLESGELVDPEGGTGTQVGGNHKLQAEAVLALLPPGTDTKKLTGRRGIMAKDGLLPDVAARLFGFPTGEAMVQALLSAPALDAIVSARTDARMLQEFSDLADPKQRELAVMRALRNEARTRLIAVDLRHVAKTLQPVRLLIQAMRKVAARQLARKPVSQISPREHVLAEARAARAFSTALREGDVAAAAGAQERRLLQHELAKLAGAALDDVDEGLDAFAGFFAGDKNLGQTRDIDLVYAGRALGSAFGLGPALSSTQERQLVSSARLKLRAEHPALASRVDSLLDDQPSGVRSWRELPLETFRELAEVGQSLWTEAGRAKTIEIDGRRRELQVVVAEGVAQIEDLPPRSAPGAAAQTRRTPPPATRLVLKGWNVVASLKRFEHWAWFMDGGKLGWFAAHVVLPLRGALSRYWAKRAEIAAKLHPQLMALRNAAGPLWDAEIAVPEASFGEGLVLRGKKELIGLLLHAGSFSNLLKALVPYGFAPNPNLTDGELITAKWETFLQRMFQKGVLTQHDIEFVRFVWGLYKELLPEDQKTHKALYGFEFHTIELRELHTPWGTLEGGYVPAIVDQDKIQAPRPSSVIESLAGEEQNFLYSIGTGRGHTLQRNPNYLKPLALDVSRQLGHIDSQLRFTHLQPAIAGVLRILRNKDFSAALNDYDREAINGVILPMLDNAALQASSRPSGLPFLDVVANWVRAGTSLAALGFNFVNAVLQLTGFSNSAAAVRGRFMRSAAVAVGRSPWESVRVAMQKSAVMNERLDATTRALRDDIARAGRSSSIPGFDEISRGVKKAQQIGGRIAFWPQRMLQGTVDVVTWHAAYQQHIADSRADGSLTEQEVEADAIAFADGVVKRSQGSNNPEDLAAYESGTPLMKLLTQFGSYSNVVLNQILGAQPGWTSKMRAIAWALVVPAFAEATLRVFLQGRPDDDKDGEKEIEELAMLYARSLTRNVTGLLPGGGPLLLSLAESDGKRVLSSPASTLLQQAWRGFVASGELAAGEDVSAFQVRAIGTMLTVLTGLPIVPITRAVGYDIDVEKGKAQPTGDLDYLRGLFVGR